MTRMRQAGPRAGRKRTYYLVCVAAAFGIIGASLSVHSASARSRASASALSGGVLLPHFFVNFKRKRRLREIQQRISRTPST